MTDRFDGVAEELDPVGVMRADRKEIDEPAAHRVFGGLHDLGNRAIAALGQLSAQRVDLDVIADVEQEAMRGDVVLRRQAVERGRRRDEHDAVREVRKPV